MCTTGAAAESLFTVELYCAVELWKEVQFVEDQLDSIELKAAAILLHHCQKNQQLRYYEDMLTLLFNSLGLDSEIPGCSVDPREGGPLKV